MSVPSPIRKGKRGEKLSIDTYSTQRPVCPHCGYEDPDWWDDDEYSNSEGETECINCEKRFTFKKILKFYTDKIRDPSNKEKVID